MPLDKVCHVCGRTFAWRKKWEDDWAAVKYCSVRCSKNKSVLRFKSGLKSLIAKELKKKQGQPLTLAQLSLMVVNLDWKINRQELTGLVRLLAIEGRVVIKNRKSQIVEPVAARAGDDYLISDKP